MRESMRSRNQHVRNEHLRHEPGVHILPGGVRMNREVYAKLVRQKFGEWLREAFGEDHGAFLVQDHEKCLWTPQPRAEMNRIGLTLLENFPKCSQDLNPIECVWKVLRDRLSETVPSHLEHRDDFVARLRAAVGWINRHHLYYLRRLCTCQKEWARDVQAACGARTKH